MTQSTPDTTNDALTSWLRTVVPGLWATLVTWLISLGLPTSVTDAVAGLGGTVVFPLALAIVYALLRWIEPMLPAGLTRIVLGSAKPPRYAPPPVDILTQFDPDVRLADLAGTHRDDEPGQHHT